MWDDTALLTVQEHEAKPEPAPPEPERVIDGSVIGYRAWRIQNWALVGTGVNRAWVPGVNEATCDPGRDESSSFFSMSYSVLASTEYGKHAAPAVGCHCGITALARFAEDDQHWPSDAIPGAIEAWSDETISSVEPGDVAAAAGVEVKGELPAHEHGRFILHGSGFRAQYGKVVLLAIDDQWPAAKRAAVRALAAEHGADVCKRSHLEDAAKEHGQLVPDEMLEWAKEGDPEPNHLPTVLLNGGFIPPTYFSSMIMPQFQISTYSSSISYMPGARPKPKPTRKGIKQTLGYPGPPANPTIKSSHGDRVKDSKGQIWQCTKGGKPGRWELEQETT